MQIDFSEVNWDTLVAVGTLLLASVTWRLARRTSDLAEITREGQAATWRPVLLLTNAEMIQRDALRWLVSFRFTNHGAGPALDLRLTFPELQPPRARSQPVPVGGDFQVECLVTDSGATATVVVRYRDLAGRDYETCTTAVGQGGQGGACYVKDMQVSIPDSELQFSRVPRSTPSL